MAHPLDTLVVKADRLVLAYGHRVAVSDLTGRFTQGAATAVIGPNGSGKSTLLKAIAGQIRPMSGVLTRPGRERIAYLPQSSQIDRTFPIRLAEMVAFGLWRRTGPLRFVTRAMKDEVSAALEMVGLAGLERRPIEALSGGQFQRALFARMSLQDADLLLLDEPFAGVDDETSGALVSLLSDWCRQGRTVIAALHDLDQVRAGFEQTLALGGVRKGWGPTADVLAMSPSWDTHRPGRLTDAQGAGEAVLHDVAV